MEVIGLLWAVAVTRPLTNVLVFLYTILGSNFGLAIIVFTILTRVVLYPFTIKQLKSTLAMQQMQPRLKALQERLKNDKTRLQREQMLLFKEAGVSPLGCLGPIILQMPIFIGMFYAIRDTLADTPEQLVSLSKAVYAWLPGGDSAIPLNSHFLGMDLGRTPQEAGGVLLVIMPVLVGGTMWVVQKMSSTASTDPTQQSTTAMMNWMFPLMFGFFTLNFPNGLAIYWIVTNVVSIALQYKVVGWGGLIKKPVPATAIIVDTPPRSRGDAPTAGPPQERTFLQKVFGLGGTPPSAPPPAAALPVPRPPSPPSAAPAAPPPKGIVNRIKRIFLGTPKVTPPPASTLAPENPDGASESNSGERQGHARDGDDREDSRRSYRQSSPSTRGRPRRRRGGGPR